MRLDQYLVSQYGFTRNKSQQLIAVGLVMVDKKICNKASQFIGENQEVTIIEDRRVSWVSRSAEKLIGFLEIIEHPINISGSNCLDVGSSTGGFTQVLLLQGAQHVDAVDVGTDQLHASLRLHPNISSYEQMDIRDFSKQQKSNYSYDIIVCDASFISLVEIIDAILELASTDTYVILLYKPQFEVGREYLRKTGVPKTQEIVDEKMKEFEVMLHSKNCSILEKVKSSLMGEAGNQEWIYMIQKKSQK
ncbi:TlyA family RNA methyltransferase [Candidatus Gracilibacteria bacterium]|nr:TlyA family RNA methyltransferase [Candidatus Gracilibacteria bacterium]